MSHVDVSNPHRIIRSREARAIVGISESTWKRWVRSGIAPHHVLVDTAGYHWWRVQDVLDWAAGRHQHNDQQAA